MYISKVRRVDQPSRTTPREEGGILWLGTNIHQVFQSIWPRGLFSYAPFSFALFIFYTARRTDPSESFPSSCNRFGPLRATRHVLPVGCYDGRARARSPYQSGLRFHCYSNLQLTTGDSFAWVEQENDFMFVYYLNLGTSFIVGTCRLNKFRPFHVRVRGKDRWRARRSESRK